MLQLMSCSLLFFLQETVEQASMGQIDPSTLTPSQLSVEKLIKEQNFTWKVGPDETVGIFQEYPFSPWAHACIAGKNNINIC